MGVYRRVGGCAVFLEMSERNDNIRGMAATLERNGITVQKRTYAEIHPDLYRLAKSLASVLERKYPDKFERRIVAARIMRDLQLT